MAISIVPARPEAAHRAAAVLRYPPRSLVLVGGVPGAGKSTLLNRVYGLDGTETATACSAQGVRIVDSQQSRNLLTPRLRTVPYPAWRWAVHVMHHVRIVLALRSGNPVIVHEPGTRWTIRRLLAWYCRCFAAEAHLVLIDAAPEEALRGQVLRGRRVTSRSHRAHTRRWRRLLAACAKGPEAVVPGARSLVLLDREQARRLTAVEFTTALSGAASRQ
ncbi:MAG: AAA family ATPase [Nocardiopsaceae bacterium]|nr:AAA family ATPase [Nocardiopsaceae bacterium]